jgi:DNA-binding response OmpR family regulator
LSVVAGSIRVLVVDDDVDLSRLVSGSLRRDGMRVVTVHDGISAVEEARRFEPDVAILDLGLPHLGGHELGKQLKALRNGSGLRLVAITADDRESAEERSLKAGFDAHVLKPLEPEALAELVRELATGD